MSFIQQFFTSRDNNANAETFVGQEGRLWWDPVTNQIYSSDGSTPGGIPLAGGGGGNGTPGGSNSQVQFNNSGTFGGSANLTFNRVSGALTAVSFSGDGSALSNIAGANVVGEVTNATYASSAVNAISAETVTANSQPNITGVGILSSLSVSGNVDAAYFIGNGSQLTGISSSSNRIFNGTSNVEIATANGNATITTNGANTWTFDTTGNLTLPGNLGANNAGITSLNAGEIVNLRGQTNGLVGIKAYGSAANLVAGVAVSGSDSETGRVTVSVFNPAIDDSEYWTFNTAGDFTTGTGNIFFGTDLGDPVIVPGSTSIKIAADRSDVTSNYISIGSSGIVIDALGGSSADIRIRASDDVFIAGGDKTANPGQTGGVINIDGGQGGPDNGFSAGDGGDVNIQGGLGGNILAGGAGDGGEVFIGGGSGSTANVVNSLSAGPGGPVTIYGGEGGQNDNNSALSNRGGNVDIYGGQGSFDFGNSIPNGDPGHVNIYGGNWGYVAPSGNIYLNSYDGTNIKTLTYDNAGNVTMAAGGSLNFVGTSSGIVQSPNNNLVIRVQDDENAAWSLYNRVTDAGNTLAETRLKRDSFSIAFPNGAGNWTFNTAGNVVFPDTTVQTTAYPGTDTTLSLTGNIGAGNVSVSGAFYGNFYAPGVDTQVVFNDNNFANADAGFTYNKTTETVSVGNTVSASNVSVTNTISGNIISASGNILGGNLTTTGAVYSNYNTNTANTGSFMATGGNTKGGTGYLDFLVAQNTSGGASNPYKWFRTTSDGQLQIINSAYTTNIFNLTDAGAFSVPGPISVGGKQAVNGPAFSAYANSSSQLITSGSQQKVLFQLEEFDTNNNYANSRFTPTVEGYYQLNAEVRLDGASGTGEMMIVLYKNGTEYKRGWNQSGTQIAGNFWAMTVSSLAYANGSTDYFEIYVQQTSGSTISVTAVSAPAITWFNGCMLRGA